MAAREHRRVRGTGSNPAAAQDIWGGVWLHILHAGNLAEESGTSSGWLICPLKIPPTIRV
jgi:hypothetical protein